MMLHWQGKSHPVRVLLDTGCSINLINQQTVERLQLAKRPHKNPRSIENFTGKTQENIRQNPCDCNTESTSRRKNLKYPPMEKGVDIFLPFRWIERHPPQGAWTQDEIRFNSAPCLEACTKYENNDFSMSWDDLVPMDEDAWVIGHAFAVSDDPLSNVPMGFRQYLGIMGKEAADALPEHRPYDCKIELKEGATAPWGPIYPLSEEELRTLREWLKEMEKTGKIKRSTSPTGSPILFVPKPNGRGLRLCVDYRGLNAVTIPNRYPLPLMQELQDRVRGAQWFTKMDLKNGFNLIRIRAGDEWKTAFRTRYGLFEFQVMPFGLTNAPSTFQDMMNHVLSNMLDVGVLAYMDDILVYGVTEERT